MELSVGEVAKRAGIKVSTLHFYEQKNLITSTRNNGNQRRYSKYILRRIAVIKAAQQVGLTLEEISESLSVLPLNKAPTKKQWEAMAKGWHQTLQARINKLQRLQQDLGSCIGCGCMSLTACKLHNPDDIYGGENNGSKLID
ncbi:redox-sensitive transcriptional activator SoxR [Reinekea marinisedimentorum]|uniref:Redox-sensitive transcriptional activator SoxR n=1 Tax=Reinekea marinisedimentorum TaxID=230495 RepID=A0A4R3I2S9_9GAMM|nr:redox-sensitive transcriptional activator SoxR [Reinekea marinisedimentorum]TCS39958.1 MerR family redox-sensitive transcriptional activator SoxR [Reinekea marinisedimentorum]